MDSDPDADRMTSDGRNQFSLIHRFWYFFMKVRSVPVVFLT